MIVPGFIVNRMYQKGSLQREPGGYYSFTYKPGVGRGTAGMPDPNHISIKNPLANLDLTALPELYVNGRLVPTQNIRLFIDGKDAPGYNEEKARQGNLEGVEFGRNTEFKVRITGDLDDGRHEFKVVVHSKQFHELIAHFSDYLGESRPAPWWKRFLQKIKGEGGIVKEVTAAPVRKTGLYILKGKKPDPDFSRLLTAFAHKEPDRVPLLELFADAEVKAAFMGRPTAGMRDEVEFHLATGYDCVPIMAPFLGPRTMMVIDSHHTTYKQGVQERAWVSERDGVIKTKKDFDSFEWPQIEDPLLSDFEEIGKFLPPEMKAIGCISAVFESVSEAMGLETFSLNLYDNPELIEAMFAKIGDLIGQYIDRMLQFDWVGAVWITDDLCHRQGPIISPKMLRRYVFPWLRKYVDRIHAKGLPAIFHSCGNTVPIFQDIIDAGFDALHPLEATSMDIYQAKKMIGDRICLVGNLDLSYMLTRGTPEEIREDVKKHIRELAHGGGYCLSSSNSITNYVPLENFLAMNRACLEFGKYPISI